MNNLFKTLSLSGLLLAFSSTVSAQVPANVVYPINGGVYSSASLITASGAVTCAGGVHTATWGFNATTLGSGRFYDQKSIQFSFKLPPGGHTFWINSPCGVDVVQFTVI